MTSDSVNPATVGRSTTPAVTVLGPAMNVAQGFSSRPPSLGIGSDMALRGGTEADLRRLDRELDFSWQPDLASVFAEAIERARSPGSPWITIAPVLLLGEDGVGRTHVARRFAHLAGVPHTTLDLEDAEVVERLQGVVRGPDVVISTAPVLAMAASGCANPVVTVLGADSVAASVQMDLARMIDPATADRWADWSIGATVDLTQVSWFVQARQPERLAAPLLELLRPIELIRPLGTNLLLHVAEVIAEVMVDENARPPTGRHLQSLLHRLQAMPAGRSTSDLYETARRVARNDQI